MMADLLKHMHQIIQTGHVTRGWLGIGVNDLDKRLAKSLKVANTNGIVVITVMRDSPAYNGRMNVGDIIISVNGKKFKNSANFLNYIASLKPGDMVNMTVIRSQRTKHIKFKVGTRPEPKVQQATRGQQKTPQQFGRF